MKQDGYQIVSELTAWKKAIPTLSKHSVGILKKSGTMKSKRDMLIGIRKGTNELLRKAGIVRKVRSRIADKIGPALIPDKKTKQWILIVPKSWSDFKNSVVMKLANPHIDKVDKLSLMDSFLRHEANEATELRRLIGSTNRQVGTSFGGIGGSHMPGIIKKEVELAKTLKPYGIRTAVNRVTTGEDALALLTPQQRKLATDEIKQTGTVDYAKFLTKKQIYKLNKARIALNDKAVKLSETNPEEFKKLAAAPKNLQQYYI